MDEQYIIYEQPLNELIRTSLRLENLFKQLDTCLFAFDVDQHTQTIVRLIVDIIEILDRPDLKSKLAKEINRFIALFSRLQAAPDINTETLERTLSQLKYLSDYFLNAHGKIAQDLRDSEFLTSVRQNLMSAGGGSSVDTPHYYYWLKQPALIRQQQIQDWLNSFKEIRESVELILSIVRDSANPKNHMADQGFYHEALDPQSSCQLIRIGIPLDLKVFPEISAGKHRISIRFVIPNINSRVIQTSDAIPFQLTTCII